MIQAQSADGVLHEFPDGTPDAVVDKAMRTYALEGGSANVAPAKPAPPKKTNALAGFMANLNSNIPFGDELVAGLSTAADVAQGKVQGNGLGGSINAIGQDFKSRMAQQRQLESGYTEEHPHVAALARGTGMASTAMIPGTPTMNAFAGSNRWMNAARGAVLAAASGAAYAAADRGTPMERVKAASNATMNPVTLALGAGAGALGTPSTPKVEKPKGNVPDLDEVRAAKSAAYKAVDEAGVKYTPEAYAQLVGDIKSEVAKSRFDPDFHATTAKMLNKLDAKVKAGYAPSLSELDDLRKFVRENVSTSPVPVESMFGQKIISQIDDFVEGATNSDIVSGSLKDAVGASDLITAARGANTKFRKLEAVTDAQEHALNMAGSTGSGGNIQNATRQGLRRILENTPNLTDEERSALQTIVRGDATQNALRAVGKLSPTGNGLNQLLHIGGAIGSHGATIPIAGVGMAAKAAAEARMNRQIDDFVRLIASDKSTVAELQSVQKQLSAIAANDPAVSALQRAVAARLSRAAGIVTGRQPMLRDAKGNTYYYPSAKEPSRNALSTFRQ